MATTPSKIPLSGLARRLIRDNLLSQTDAEQACQDALKQKVAFVSHLVDKKILAASKIALAASHEFGVPLFDVEALEGDPAVFKLVKEDLIRQHGALPLFKRGMRLFVAVSDPTNLQALDEVKFFTKLAVEAVLVEDDKLRRAIDRAMAANDTSMKDMLGDDDLSGLDVIGGEDVAGPGGGEAAAGPDIDDAPVVKFVNKILLDAIKSGASDIHFEPYEKLFRVRFRQDGLLHEVAQPPLALAPRLIARLKVMARMDISERRVPQDGRIKLLVSKNRAIDFRANTCPTLFGEKVVMRILDPTSATFGIEALGYEEEQRKAYLSALSKPYGMILVTGPTGSGKTVSLYTGLGILNTVDRNISTAEDPVEINMPGINQLNVNVKTGLTFPIALRAFLRQDPDVIMVGEIRDLETAEIAVKAAQTGHLVLSTLHTNDGPQTLTRLMNMGIPTYNIASSVVLIIAQRLARKLCPSCKREEKIPAEVLLKEGFTETQLATNFTLFGPGLGCDSCKKGYKGRVGIYQVMPISEAMAKLIMEGGTSLQLGAQAKREGINNLRESGLKKIISGLTSLEEINRVTKE